MPPSCSDGGLLRHRKRMAHVSHALVLLGGRPALFQLTDGCRRRF